LDSTYYCYGGEHRYRAVPHVLSAKLNMIEEQNQIFDFAAAVGDQNEGSLLQKL
jgi:hypothetical protein